MHHATSNPKKIGLLIVRALLLHPTRISFQFISGFSKYVMIFCSPILLSGVSHNLAKHLVSEDTAAINSIIIAGYTTCGSASSIIFEALYSQKLLTSFSIDLFILEKGIYCSSVSFIHQFTETFLQTFFLWHYIFSSYCIEYQNRNFRNILIFLIFWSNETR